MERDASGYATRVHRHALFIRMTEYLFEKYFYNKERLLSKNRDLLNNAINEQIQLQGTAEKLYGQKALCHQHVLSDKLSEKKRLPCF